MKECVNECLTVQMFEWATARRNKCTKVRLYGRMEEWMNECMNV